MKASKVPVSLLVLIVCVPTLVVGFLAYLLVYGARFGWGLADSVTQWLDSKETQ